MEILNENDNKPNFLEETIQPFTINEVQHGGTMLLHPKETTTDYVIVCFTLFSVKLCYFKTFLYYCYYCNSENKTVQDRNI